MFQKGMILNNRYKIIREIGSGGTGVIYLAYYLNLNKYVVIKKVKENFAGSINARAEVDILKNLHHTYLPQVYDFIQMGTMIYTVLDYIEGRDFQYYINNKIHFSEKQIRTWLLQLCEVLDYLHSQPKPIYHSDIKPGNIMLKKDGNICLIDFNISIDGENSKDISGISPWFAAPEQYEKVFSENGHKIVLDQRMDIYSLGATFYRIMSGLLPDPEKEYPSLMNMELSYSDGLKAVIQKAVHRNPSGRFQSAAKMKQALLQMEKLDPRYRRYTLLQFLCSLLYGLLMIGGVLSIYYGIEQNHRLNWQRDYQQFYEYVHLQEEDEIREKGIEILNSSQYEKILDRQPKKKAEIISAVADSCYEQEEYEQAAEFYREAWDLDKRQQLCALNYIISLCESDRTSKAKSFLSEAKEWVYEPEGMELAEAEIAFKEGENDGALVLLSKLSAQTGDDRLYVKAKNLQASIYEETGDYANAAKAQKEAAQKEKSRRNLRACAQLCMKAAENDQGAMQKAYREEALSCYEQLNKMPQPSYEDQMNYAIVLRSLGKYSDSNEILQNLYRDYKENYQISMWLCYNYLSLENSSSGYSEDAKFYYGIAKRLYSGTEDAQMEQLMEWMEGEDDR